MRWKLSHSVQLRHSSMLTCSPAPAGLIFIRQPEDPTSSQPRLSTIFFILMLNALSGFSYMGFYVTDRKFFQRCAP